MRQLTIEERALKIYGTTKIPEFGGYILLGGELLNFSYEGRQRDVDHRDINDLFVNADGFTAMQKFMRRGNIRCSCSDCGYGFELVKLPTREQWLTLHKIYRQAEARGLSFFVERKLPSGKFTTLWYEDLVRWLDDNADYLLF